MPSVAAVADPSPLACLAERRDEVLSSWFAVYRERAGRRAAIAEPMFFAVFGRELEQLASSASVDAALRVSGNRLLREGVALADALVAGGALEPGALACVDDPRVSAALCELERRRTRLWCDAWLATELIGSRACGRRVGEPVGHAVLGDAWGLVGESPEMRRLRDGIAVAAKVARAILIVGEPGSGKELVARAVHDAAGDGGPFVAVRCGALPRDVLARELAEAVAAAHGGTVFVDELPQMGVDVQAALTTVDLERVRLIASTAEDPRSLVAAGRLRAEVVRRLSFGLSVPPLRAHRSDIPLLVEHFLGSFCSRRSGCVSAVTPDAMAALTAWDWPGNVRELRAVVDDAVVAGATEVIGVGDLPERLRTGPPSTASASSPARREGVPTLAEAEAQLIRLALVAHHGNKLRAAKALGISRHKLYDKLKELDLG